MVHQMNHCDRVVVFKIIQKTFRQIFGDIFLQIDQAVFDKLHDTDPRQQFCHRSPFENRFPRHFGIFIQVLFTFICFVDDFNRCENRKHHSSIHIIIFFHEFLHFLIQVFFLYPGRQCHIYKRFKKRSDNHC